MAFSFNTAYSPTHAEVSDAGFRRDLARRGYCPIHETVKVRERSLLGKTIHTECHHCLEITRIKIKQIENEFSSNTSKQQELLKLVEKEKIEKEEFESKLFDIENRLKEAECLLQLRIKDEKKRLNIAEKKVLFPIKIVLVGDSGVGKSVLMTRYTTGTFIGVEGTMGLNFKVTNKVENIKLQIFDTAGQERFRTITASNIRGAEVVCICLDLSRSLQSNLQDARGFYNMVLNHGDSRTKVLFVGCKSDLLGNQNLLQELEAFAEERNSSFIPVSASQD